MPYSIPRFPTAAEEFALEQGKWKTGPGARQFYDELMLERERYRQLLINSTFTSGKSQLAISLAQPEAVEETAVSRLTFAAMYRLQPAIPPPKPSITAGRTPPQSWREAYERVARTLLAKFQQVEDERHYLEKLKAYGKEADKLVRDYFYTAATMEKDKSPERTVLICPPDKLSSRIVNLAVTRWEESLQKELNDDTFYRDPSEKFLEYLQSRKEPSVLLRSCQLLEFDEEGYINCRWPAGAEWVEDVIEFAISMIPLVGDLVTLYEIQSGHDLFGRPLSPEERVIMGAAFLIPLGLRFAKGGRALYSAEKLAYILSKPGEKPAVEEITKVLEMSARVSVHPEEMGQVIEASSEIFMKRVSKGSVIVQKAVKGVGVIFKSKFPSQAINKKAEDLIFKVARFLGDYGVLSHQIDKGGIIRILKEAFNPSNVKGQLFEEIMESQIWKALVEKHGPIVLGLHSKGVQGVIEYWPGHLIRDFRKGTKGKIGRKLSDGLLLRRLSNGKVEIIGLIEAKSGLDDNVAKLAVQYSKHPERSAAFKRLLKDAVYDAELIAKLEGEVWNEGMAKEVEEALQAEGIDFFRQELRSKGQIVKTIERLETDKAIRLNGVLTQVELDRNNIQILGVVSKGADQNFVKDELKKVGLSIHFENIPFTDGDLRKMTEFIMDAVRDAGDLIF